MKQSPRRSLQPQDPVGFSLPVTQTQELTRGKCSPEQCLFLQQKNIDFILITAKGAQGEDARHWAGSALAVAPCPCPMAGTEPPTAARVPRLEPAPARGWDRRCGSCPSSGPGLSLLPQPRSAEPLLGKLLSKMPPRSWRVFPAEGRNPVASSSVERWNDLVGPLLAWCSGAWRRHKGCPGLPHSCILHTRVEHPSVPHSCIPQAVHAGRAGHGAPAGGAGWLGAGEPSVNRDIPGSRAPGMRKSERYRSAEGLARAVENGGLEKCDSRLAWPAVPHRRS